MSIDNDLSTMTRMVTVEIGLAIAGKAIAGNCQQFPTPVFHCHAGKWKWKCREFPTPSCSPHWEAETLLGAAHVPRVHRAAAKVPWLLANKLYQPYGTFDVVLEAPDVTQL